MRMDGTISGASKLLEEAGVDLEPSAMNTVTTKANADLALLEGRLVDAVSSFTTALRDRRVDGPQQEPIPSEPVEWEGTSWRCVDERGAFGAALLLQDSLTTFEFGSCDDGRLLLTDCAVTDDSTLTGYFEGEEGTGEFELSMNADGRRFVGSIVWDEDGSAETWLGSRVSESAWQEEPPSEVRWLFEALVGRSRALLQLGRSEESLEDARSAAYLCCRVVDGWAALADAAEACGATEEVLEAQQQIALLRGE